MHATILALDQSSRANEYFYECVVADCIAGFCGIGFSAVLSAPRRRRLHAYLSRLGQTPEERKAAAVAALVGRVTDERVMELADSAFRVIPWSALNATHWASSGDTGLHLHAQPAALGDCDAFLSHSWHDDPGTKWAALEIWARLFEESHGRQPSWWLDYLLLTTYLPMTYYLLLTTCYLLLTTYYSLLTTHYSPLSTHYLLLTTHYSLLTTYYLLLTTYYLLLTTYYLLLTTHYSLLTTHYSLLTTHYSLLTTHY